MSGYWFSNEYDRSIRPKCEVCFGAGRVNDVGIGDDGELKTLPCEECGGRGWMPDYRDDKP